MKSQQDHDSLEQEKKKERNERMEMERNSKNTQEK